jgi:hypothetical protein
VTGYKLGTWGVRICFPGKDDNFYFHLSSRLALGTTQPPIQWVVGTLSWRVKWLGRESDQLPPASAETKKMRVLYICSPICLLGIVLNYLSTGTSLPFTFTIVWFTLPLSRVIGNVVYFLNHAKIPCCLHSLKVYYCTHKNPLLIPALHQINAILCIALQSIQQYL